MKNISISTDASAVVFQPITINSLAELQALIANPPEPGFAPVVIVLQTKAQLANLLGMAIAYGTANVYAENGLKSIGLGEYYTGNVRGFARELATNVASVSGIVSMPSFTEYKNSVKFGKKSKAGAAVIGTDEDLAPGRAETHFEPTLTTPTPAVAVPVARPRW